MQRKKRIEKILKIDEVMPSSVESPILLQMIMKLVLFLARCGKYIKICQTSSLDFTPKVSY